MVRLVKEYVKGKEGRKEGKARWGKQVVDISLREGYEREGRERY